LFNLRRFCMKKTLALFSTLGIMAAGLTGLTSVQAQDPYVIG
jgi:hypothetical protein